MIPGGIAGKLGNRYEVKWLVRCFMDVIADKAQWLNFESVETEYRGFEFAIARGEITEWHQCKMNGPGNWTINGLKREGVLKAFSNRLSTSENAHCFFVSQDNASIFNRLEKKSKTANSSQQYLEILSKEQRNHFLQLKDIWHQSDEVAFNWLKRSHVETLSEGSLDTFIDSYGDLYFQSGGKSAYPNLRDILENHFNKTLTPESARAAIKSHGVLQFKAWEFDPCISQRLKAETDAYLRTYTPFGAGGETISRDQSTALVDEILKADGPDLILLTGVAGSGKSGVVRSAIEQLRKHDAPHLAFRVDWHLSYCTKEELGKKLTGREESPVSTLKGTFPEITSVLFIDQVDAVSEVSGREGQVKEVIFRLITDAAHFGGVKILIVCRTFDLESDPRLKRLKSKNRTKQIEVSLLSWNADIEPLLKNKNIDVSTFKEPQRQLLCLPINLAVFLEIDDPDFLFYSRFSLHEKLIEKKQRAILNKRKPSWHVIKPLTAMCNWMSQRQILSAPDSVLDDYTSALDILRSEGLIISSRGDLNFFHESFFDHIYARAFLNYEQSLIDFLTESEQHLFRRTQVRQILEALRQGDRSRYLKELSEVLPSDKIRFHIKAAICQWLNTVENASEAEFKIVFQFNEASGKFHSFFRSAILSTHAWFDLLNEKKWIKPQLEGTDKIRTEAVLWWFSNIAGERPKEVAGLLRSWWGGNAERANRLLSWFGYIRRAKPDDKLLQLCEDLINSHPANLFKEQGRDRIMMLLHTWTEKSPEQCGRMLHALFEAWFALHPRRNPLARDEGKVFDTHSLTKLERKAPLAFLRGTTDSLVRSIDMVVAEGKSGRYWYDFNRMIHSKHLFGFDGFLTIYRSALNKVAKEHSENALIYLKKLDPHKHKSLMHLHLGAIQANPIKLGHLLPLLVTDKLIFEAGWDGANWTSFAHACRATFPHLDSDEKKCIEKIILGHSPELNDVIRFLQKNNQESKTELCQKKERVTRSLNYSGYQQWCILETIGKDLLCADNRSRLTELHRKFPKKKVAKSVYTEMREVGSPIKQVHCERMNDHDWLSAIKRYDDEKERHRGHDFVVGGARDLAAQLREVTKKDPERFAKLSLKITDTAHHAYIEHILWGLEESEAPSDELLVRVILRANQHTEKPFVSRITWLIEKHPHIAANPEILDILIGFTLNGKADEGQDLDDQNTERETIDIESLIERGGRPPHPWHQWRARASLGNPRDYFMESPRSRESCLGDNRYCDKKRTSDLCALLHHENTAAFI